MGKMLGPYLAGLIEGDGTIVVPKNERSVKGKLNYPSIQICFAAKDYPLAVALRLILGHGSISKRTKQAAYVFTVNDKEGIIKIASLINGYMRTQKYHDLVELIHFINKKTLGLNIVALPLDTSKLLSNPWLTGFIEADGSFQVRTNFKTQQNRLAVTFELSQACSNHDNLSSLGIITLLAETLGVNVTINRPDSKHPCYRVRTSTLQNNAIIVHYLQQYPLQGTKIMDFED
jgi:hypothetical protein